MDRSLGPSRGPQKSCGGNGSAGGLGPLKVAVDLNFNVVQNGRMFSNGGLGVDVGGGVYGDVCGGPVGRFGGRQVGLHLGDGDRSRPDGPGLANEAGVTAAAVHGGSGRHGGVSDHGFAVSYPLGASSGEGRERHEAAVFRDGRGLR